MKKVVYALLLIVMSMVLSGCSDKSGGGGGDAPAQTDEGPEVSSLLNPIYYSNTAVLEGSIDLGSTSTARATQAVSASFGTLYLVGDPIVSTLSGSGIDSLEAIPAPFSFSQVEIADDGSYRIEDLPAGTNYQLVYIDGTNGTNLGDITLKAGTATTQDITSVSANIPSVTAYIKNLDGAVPEGAALKIHQTGQTLSADSTTGLVTLTNLPAGTYTFTVSATDYVSKVFSIELTSSLTTLETIELNSEKGGIAGTVTIDGNENHANIIVYAKAADGSVYTALTDASGDYTFPALPVDTGYSVIATANGLQSAQVKDVTVVSGITNTVSSMTLSVLNTTREGDKGSIIGHARFAEVTGLNHAGILVSIEGTDYEAVTSRDGSFILNSLAEGSYTVNFTDSNHQTHTEAIEVVAGGVTKVDDVTLQAKQIILTEIENLSLDLMEDFSDWVLQIELDSQFTGDVVFTVSSSNPSLLSVEMTADNKLKLISQPNQFGSALITVQAASSTITDIRKFNVVVNQVNDFPTITTISLTTNEDTTINTTLQASDLESETLTFSLLTDVSHGTLTLQSDGNITYVPDTNYNGSDLFGFRVTDEDNASVDQNVTITVVSVNDLPQFTSTVSGTFSGNQEITQGFGVSDPDSDTLTYSAAFSSVPDGASPTITVETYYHYVATCEDGTVYEDNATLDQATIDTYNQYIADQTPLAGCNGGPLVSFVYDSPSPTVSFTADRVGDYLVDISAADEENNVTQTFTFRVTEAWQDVGDGFFSRTVSGGAQAVIDNNVTYVVYANPDATTLIDVMKYDGSWSLLPDTGLDTDNKSDFSLAVVDSTLYLYVLVDLTPGTTSGEYPTVYKFNGSSWSVVGGGPAASDVRAASNGMIVDGSDIYVHVSSSDGTMSSWPSGYDNNTSIYKLVDDTWELQAEYLSDVDDIDLNRLVAVSGGEFYVMPTENITNSFSVYHYNGSTWDQVGGAAYTETNTTSVRDLSVLSGQPAVAYTMPDANGSYYPYLIRFNGTGWDKTGGGATTDTEIHYASSMIVYYLDGQPYVWTYEDKPTYRNAISRYVDGAWEKVGPMWGNGEYGVIFNNYDKPYMIYGETNSSSSTQLKMIEYADITPSLDAAEPSKRSSVYPSQWFDFTFDRALDSGVTTSGTVLIKDALSVQVSGTLSLEGDRTISFIPDSALTEGASYTVGIADIASDAGDVSPFDINYSFSVKAVEPLFATHRASLVDFDDGYYGRGADRNYSVITVNAGNSQYIVRDNVTGLEWEDNGSVQYDYADAGTYCDGLDFGGYSDWRLPTLHELYTLVDINYTNPSITSLFTNIQSSHYWTVSRTSYGNPDTYGLNRTYVNFYYGGYDNADKSTDKYVRCVRGSMSDDSFSRDDTNEIVIDHKDGLMWQDDTGVNTPDMNWSQAIDYCESLSLGGHTDWSLPNLYELASIINIENSRYADDFDDPEGLVDVFVNDRGYHYWTSTTMSDDNSSVWSIYSSGGSSSNTVKSSTSWYVRCVRAIP